MLYIYALQLCFFGLPCLGHMTIATDQSMVCDISNSSTHVARLVHFVPRTDQELKSALARRQFTA